MASSHDSTVKVLLERFGQTFAEQAGIHLADKPSPLYELLVLATLLSARISGDVAVAAAKELFAAGYRTPQRMQDASWQDRVDALGRGHYRRYDERTSTMLGEAAALLLERWNGDLRKLRDEAGADPQRIRELLTEFKGIGPVGADIFLREVQGVWPQVAPYLDDRVRRGAERIGLPSDVARLADLVDSPGELARLSSALIRVSRSSRAADEIKHAAAG
ncbi:MAG TPA: endonuclease [Pseudonocardiaceae bacterium]|jgi:endonuclease III|nr:endonuclease [Pseudonocardiaceae bacterium]